MTRLGCISGRRLEALKEGGQVNPTDNQRHRQLAWKCHSSWRELGLASLRWWKQWGYGSFDLTACCIGMIHPLPCMILLLIDCMPTED